jgi:N-methylhydantoinase A
VRAGGAGALAGQAGCEAVCVFFINAYANPRTRRARGGGARALAQPYVTAATEILPEIREFERLSTTALNAYLQPEVSGYLDRLDRALTQRVWRRVPDRAVERRRDGDRHRLPLPGAHGAVRSGRRRDRRGHIAEAAGFDNIITCDMGGTSFDVSLIADGQAALAPQTSIDFGMVVRTPMIEITTIGAGGGSIAWVDKGGLLNIGPGKRRLHPGPVAYGLGNDRPTVTDANVVLGRINPDRPIGGKLDRLDVEAARAPSTPMWPRRWASASRMRPKRS